MNDRNLDQLLNAWMDLGPTTAPDRVADAARFEVSTTRQLPAILSRWAPRRFPVMNTYAKVALASAAVAVAALLGYNYLVAPNVGGPTFFGRSDAIPVAEPCSHRLHAASRRRHAAGAGCLPHRLRRAGRGHRHRARRAPRDQSVRLVQGHVRLGPMAPDQRREARVRECREPAGRCVRSRQGCRIRVGANRGRPGRGARVPCRSSM